MRLNKRVLPSILLIAGLLSACGGEDLATAPHPSDNQAIVVPATLGGLSAKLSEDATKRLKKAAARDSYARDVQVFELRQGKELRAAFEVLRLAPDANTSDPEFRKKVFGLIGGSSRPPKAIQGIPVFETVQNEQYIYVWFHGQFMQVLIVRASATQVGQAVGVNVQQLLNEALALRPVTV